MKGGAGVGGRRSRLGRTFSRYLAPFTKEVGDTIDQLSGSRFFPGEHPDDARILGNLIQRVIEDQYLILGPKQ